MKTVKCMTGFWDLEVQAMIGVYAEELTGTQTLLVSLEMHYPHDHAGNFVSGDDVALALDYQIAADLVVGVLSQQRFGLLEHLCATLADRIFRSLPLASGLKLEVKKPHAVPGSRGSFCILEAEPGDPDL